jgi:hypothetical protein
MLQRVGQAQMERAYYDMKLFGARVRRDSNFFAVCRSMSELLWRDNECRPDS